jgi:hypothetical protein
VKAGISQMKNFHQLLIAKESTPNSLVQFILGHKDYSTRGALDYNPGVTDDMSAHKKY